MSRCRAQVSSGLDALEARWAPSDRVMQPEVTLGCVLHYLRTWQWALPAKLAALLARCDQLPELVATEPAVDEAMPAAPL